VVRIKTAFDDMSGDLRMLGLVEQNHERLGEGLSRRLNGLFGYFGPTIANRVSQFAGHDASAVGLADLESGIEEIRTNYALASGECRDILQHAISRLEQIADVLEQGGTFSATDAVTGTG